MEVEDKNERVVIVLGVICLILFLTGIIVNYAIYGVRFGTNCMLIGLIGSCLLYNYKKKVDQKLEENRQYMLKQQETSTNGTIS